MSASGPYYPPGATVPGTKYQVVKSLGAGGMGIVYQVVKPPNIGGVLKLMSADLIAHAEHRQRFFDEVRILAQLDHPNIVRVFDYDALPNGTPYYVMELLSGRTVRDVLDTMGRVPPRIAYEVTRQLLDALQAAHTHEVPVIHRDIKPENIFLHAPRHGEPLVKLIDFGVSAVGDRDHDGSFVGTWTYAAPEQIRGEVPTAETDLYAVALVLYEMLCGRGPFDHHSEWQDVSMAQLEEIPAPVSHHAPWVPASIVALIQATLSKDPRNRPRSAWEFAEKLYELEYANDAPPTVVHTPTPPPGRARRDVVRPDGEVSVAGTGPLARVLTSVAAAPVSSRPLTPRRPPDNSTNALLEGLGGSEPRRTPMRGSAPVLAVAARPPPASGATAVTLEEDLGVVGGGKTDTFSSHSTGAHGVPKKGRLVVVLAVCGLVFASALAATVLVFRQSSSTVSNGAPPPPKPAPLPTPSVVVAPAEMAAPPSATSPPPASPAPSASLQAPARTVAVPTPRPVPSAAPKPTSTAAGFAREM